MVYSDTASAPLFERTWDRHIASALFVGATTLPRQCVPAAGARCVTGLDPAEFLSLVEAAALAPSADNRREVQLEHAGRRVRCGAVRLELPKLPCIVELVADQLAART